MKIQTIISELCGIVQEIVAALHGQVLSTDHATNLCEKLEEIKKRLMPCGTTFVAAERCPKCGSTNTYKRHADTPNNAGCETDWKQCEDCEHQWDHQ